MGLSDIAAGIEVTTEQRERGVPTVDDTGVDLRARIDEHADELPCDPAAAAVVLKSYADGASVGESARTAGVAPMTAAKALHRCGVTGVTPLSPGSRTILRDWLAGTLSRADAHTLTDASDAEFALAAYVETHEAVPALAEAVEATLAVGGNASVEKRETLAGTMSAVTDLY